MFNRLFKRWALMEEVAVEGGASGGAATTTAAATDAAATETTAVDTGLKMPDSLLGDPAVETKEGEVKTEETKVEEAKPIEYTDFKVPDGLTIDAEKLGAFKAIAAEAKMPQEVAQKMLDIYTAEFKQITEAPMRAWTALQNTWRDEVKNDPVIGGANLDKNLATVKTGLKNLLGEDAGKFFEALNITGAGNNPEIVRGLLKAAAPHAPATAVNGSPGKGGGKTAGATLYPTMNGLGNGHEG